MHLARKNQMGAGIGQKDARHRAAEANRGAPLMGLGRRKESALLGLSAAEVVLVVVLAFFPRRSTHGLIITRPFSRT